MRLSEAIRLGSLLGPQEVGKLVGPNHSSCAIGAILLALGINAKDHGHPYCVAEDHFPTLKQRLLPSEFGFPVFTFRCSFIDGAEEERRSLLNMIWLLNDSSGWTREQIADWIVANNLDCDSVILTQQEQHEHQADLVTA